MFRPDGKYVITASDDKTARVWEASTGRNMTVLQGHKSAVTSAAFSPDGRWVVTTSWDSTAQVWDLSKGQRVLILHGHTAPVLSAVFSPDGKRVVTASKDGTTRIHSCEVCVPLEDLEALARKRATRELIRAERQKYLHEK
jgi:WD40 repeat protein